VPQSKPDPELAPGLYLVATPIGNLEDITLRALRVLRIAARIACEDTRQTQKLLNHFGIATPTVSLHQHNEHPRAAELVAYIQSGQSIALVSDAGTPSISDPGFTLTQAVLNAGLAVIPIPGPNAAIAALIASGLPTAAFQFFGFLPEKAGPRRSFLESLASRSGAQDDSNEVPTFIFYEAPHRILDTLLDLEAVWGPALPVTVARELTKVHEEFLRGTVAEVRATLGARDRIRGEFTLLLQPLPPPSDPPFDPRSLLTRLQDLQTQGLSEMDALKRLARESGQGKSHLYRELQRERAKSANPSRRG
jgi:16S rRNA (cytidine1402-2'-O)-methyltransferase